MYKLTIDYKNGNKIEERATAINCTDESFGYIPYLNPTQVYVKPVVIRWTYVNNIAIDWEVSPDGR